MLQLRKGSLVVLPILHGTLLERTVYLQASVALGFVLCNKLLLTSASIARSNALSLSFSTFRISSSLASFSLNALSR